MKQNTFLAYLCLLSLAWLPAQAGNEVGEKVSNQGAFIPYGNGYMNLRVSSDKDGLVLYFLDQEKRIIAPQVSSATVEYANVNNPKQKQSVKMVFVNDLFPFLTTTADDELSFSPPSDYVFTLTLGPRRKKADIKYYPKASKAQPSSALASEENDSPVQQTVFRSIRLK